MPSESESSPQRRPRIVIAPTRRQLKTSTALIVRETYLQALYAAGALPIVLATTDRSIVEEFLSEADGLLLPGGADLHPRLYGDEPRAQLDLLDDDIAELHVEFARVAYRTSVPTLGICLGCQTMSVALGGSLVQDLPNGRRASVQHQTRAGKVVDHSVSVNPGSRLFAILGTSQVDVPSQHHQAIDRIGTDLKATAYAPDNVIEAIEHATHPFFVGVQWHAEAAPDSSASIRLFSAFARAAVEHASQRESVGRLKPIDR